MVNTMAALRRKVPACPLRARGRGGLWRGPPILTLSALPFILSLSCVTWLLAKSSDLERVLTHPMEGPCGGPPDDLPPRTSHPPQSSSVCAGELLWLPLPSCPCAPSRLQTRGGAGRLQTRAALPCLRLECGDGGAASRGSKGHRGPAP